MSQSELVTVVDESTGRIFHVSPNGLDAFYAALLRSGEEASTPEPEPFESAPIPEGMHPAGYSNEALDRDGRHYPKHSMVVSRQYSDNSTRYFVVDENGNKSKIAKSLVEIPGKAETAKPSVNDANYNPGTIQLVIAGTTLKCRVTEGKLRHGGEATNIHFADDLRKVDNADSVRKALSSNGWRFSYHLTKNTADSGSSWYINSVFTIAQIQEMLS